MTDDERLAFTLLETFHFASLRRIGPRKYEFFGRVPAFYEALFPSDGDGPCTTPWRNSQMLDFFLGEAEDFFARGETGHISSGVWEEDGLTQLNTALMATAVNLGDEQVISIRLLREDYAERLDVLRKARAQLLENRQLNTNLSVFKEKSRIDGLTCIFNRATFMDLMVDEMKRSRIMHYPLVLVMLDVDNFKHVNDTYGHLAGDKILHGMGGVLKHSLRRNDIVARYGGEEFAVLIPNTPLKEAALVAEKIRANVAAMVMPDAPQVTVSLGCTAFLPDEPAEEFIQRADEALYDAKKGGKNKVCVK